MLTALSGGTADATVDGRRLARDDLADAVGAVAASVRGAGRVAVVASPTLHTVVAVCGVLAAGGCVVPVNPAAGAEERAHVLSDATPDLVLDAGDVDLGARAPLPATVGDDDQPALVVYTSGTTGPPKGAVLPRRAVVACLDALAARWELSSDDTLAHALPLFHVHGLVLGTLGAMRVGMRLVVGTKFAPVRSATVYYAVPTMWGRTSDADLDAMRSARLLVSGSAALPAPVFDRVRATTGLPLVERYGLTESLIVTAATPAAAAPGLVGPALDGIGVRIDTPDGDGMGEVQVGGPTLFAGYLNRADATDAALTGDGWLRTGDLGRYDADRGLRLLGRLATDLVKTGGFKVGAGEVEDALLAHAAVAEAAVTGEPDDDLGERIVAWVVVHAPVTADELVDHVARILAPHKRPREVRFVEALPRNAMGKLQKTRLTGPDAT